MKTKQFRKKVSQRQRNLKGGPFSLILFCMLRLKSERKGGTLSITEMRFPRIRLVEQTEQKFRRFESVKSAN